MKIAIIGRGNVATHLYYALSKNHDVVMVNPHTLEQMPKDAEIALITVTDSAIVNVAEHLKGYDGVVAHTSGSTPISVLRAKKSGVFYPLQTFSKDVTLNYSEIPFFIEGNNKNVHDILKSLALTVSKSVYDADSETRRCLHIASVFACNYVNHMLTIADDLLGTKSLDISVLKPLIAETLRKVNNVSPRQAQTGPAVRGDHNIIDSHIEMLRNNDRRREIYQLLAEDIMESH